MGSQSSYWVPSKRWQLLHWFKVCRPAWKVARWSKAKMMAVYFKERSKE